MSTKWTPFLTAAGRPQPRVDGLRDLSVEAREAAAARGRTRAGGASRPPRRQLHQSRLVAHLTGTNAGVQNFLSALSHDLQQKGASAVQAGHEVTFAAAAYPGAARSEIRDGIRVVRLRGIHSLWLTTFAYYMTRCRGRFDVDSLNFIAEHPWVAGANASIMAAPQGQTTHWQGLLSKRALITRRASSETTW